MLYIQTKDLLYVKEFLGHVNINNTLKYVHVANAIAESEESYVCRVAKHIREAKELVEAGFEYVTTIGGAQLFRKRK